MAGEPELIKVRLTDRGEDSETPWAHDLGPAPGPPGSLRWGGPEANPPNERGDVPGISNIQVAANSR